MNKNMFSPFYRFVNMLVIHFGNSAASTVSKYRDADYPLLLIVMKSKAGLEVCSILQGMDISFFRRLCLNTLLS